MHQRLVCTRRKIVATWCHYNDIAVFDKFATTIVVIRRSVEIKIKLKGALPKKKYFEDILVLMRLVLMSSTDESYMEPLRFYSSKLVWIL